MYALRCEIVMLVFPVDIEWWTDWCLKILRLATVKKQKKTLTRILALRWNSNILWTKENDWNKWQKQKKGENRYGYTVDRHFWELVTSYTNSSTVNNLKKRQIDVNKIKQTNIKMYKKIQYTYYISNINI